MGLINVAVSSCSAAQAKIIFAASKVKTSGKNGAKAGWRAEMGRSADLLPLWSLEDWKQLLHQGDKMLFTPFFGNTFPVCHCFCEVAVTVPGQSSPWSVEGPGPFHWCRQCGVVWCPWRPSTLLQSTVSLHIQKKLFLLVSLNSVVSQLQEQT